MANQDESDEDEMRAAIDADMRIMHDDARYLRDLAETLRRIPVMYGTDDGDIARLHEIAKRLDAKG